MRDVHASKDKEWPGVGEGRVRVWERAGCGCGRGPGVGVAVPDLRKPKRLTIARVLRSGGANLNMTCFGAPSLACHATGSGKGGGGTSSVNFMHTVLKKPDQYKGL